MVGAFSGLSVREGGRRIGRKRSAAQPRGIGRKHRQEEDRNGGREEA